VRLTIDLETDGFLDKVTKIWCICARDIDTEQRYEWSTLAGDIQEGVEYLGRASYLCGHNVAGCDLPVLEKLHGFEFTGELFDTQRGAELCYVTSLLARSLAHQRKVGEKGMPSALLKSNKLKAWGYRLGHLKGTYLEDHGGGAPKECDRDLIKYCHEDVAITTELRKHLLTKGTLFNKKRRTWSKPCSERSIICDSWVGYFTGRQERNGVGFDERGAEELYVKIAARRDALGAELTDAVKPWWVPDAGCPKCHARFKRPKKRPEEGYKCAECGHRFAEVGPATFTPKVRSKRFGYEPGCPLTKVKLVSFNPASAAHIQKALERDYGWKPKEFGKDGVATANEDTLAPLDYEIIPRILEYNMLQKRCQAIAEGRQAYLRHVKDGAIHGRVKPAGTRNARCSHSHPNLGQTTAKPKPYWEETRSLFIPRTPGWVMVGQDASGIEARTFGHRLAQWDGGEFMKLVCDDADIHTRNMKLMGLFTRELAKNSFYLVIYGGMDPKLGLYVLEDWRLGYEQGLTSEKPPGKRFAAELGAAARRGLYRGMAGFEPLVEACGRAYERGYIVGIDGRIIPCKTRHGGVNDLLASDASIIMKHALGIKWRALAATGLPEGERWRQMLYVHDEFQDETEPELAETIGQAGVDAIVKAGEFFGIRGPLAGKYKVGANWAETH
jgi:hypothetical protein